MNTEQAGSGVGQAAGHGPRHRLLRVPGLRVPEAAGLRRHPSPRQHPRPPGGCQVSRPPTEMASL